MKDDDDDDDDVETKVPLLKTYLILLNFQWLTSEILFIHV
jgi:hypothetical protein